VRRPQPPLSYAGTQIVIVIIAVTAYQSGGSGRRTPNEYAARLRGRRVVFTA
jgi:hypothetical protein